MPLVRSPPLTLPAYRSFLPINFRTLEHGTPVHSKHLSGLQPDGYQKPFLLLSTHIFSVALLFLHSGITGMYYTVQMIPALKMMFEFQPGGVIDLL